LLSSFHFQARAPLPTCFPIFRRDKRLSASTAFARAVETREVIDVKWRRVRALLLLLHKLVLLMHGLLHKLLMGLLLRELLLIGKGETLNGLRDVRLPQQLLNLFLLLLAERHWLCFIPH